MATPPPDTPPSFKPPPPPKFHLGAGLRVAGIFSALREGRSGTDSSQGAHFFLNLGGRKVGREDGSAERYQSLSRVFHYGALWEGRGGGGGGLGVVRERGREG